MVSDLSEDGVSDQTAEDFLCMVLAGPLTEAPDRPVPEWPLDPDSTGTSIWSPPSPTSCSSMRPAIERVLERTRRLVSDPDFSRLVAT